MKLASSEIASHKQYTPFPSKLLSSDLVAFQVHLQSRSAEILAAVKQMFSQQSPSVPDPAAVQSEITQLLVREKLHINELEKSRLEVEQLNKYLEDASLRYMLAEKRYDRQKSKPVAKLEAQAVLGGKSETGSGLGGGDSKEDTSAQRYNEEHLAEITKFKREIEAASSKQKQQLSALASENEKLSAELTSMKNRFSRLNDDDCSRTDLYKYVKLQHEDVIKRINDLEAKNIQLRAEAEKLQAERTAHRASIEAEAQIVIAEKESQLSQNENDLTRIRAARDELLAEIAIRKAAQISERTSTEQIRDLMQTKADRIKSLEEEVDRLTAETDSRNGLTGLSPAKEEQSFEDLETRYSTLDRQYSMLKNELKSMGQAYQKSSALAAQKILGLSELEDKAVRMSAEKAKADQKYFAAMKAKEARDQELRTLRAQNSKSSEIVSQLKEADAANRAMVVNLEKQVAEIKTIHSGLTSKHLTCQQQINERNITIEGLKAQIEELKKGLTAKDSEYNTVSDLSRKAEVEIETLNVRLEETEKSLKIWKGRASSDQSSENEMLRVGFPYRVMDRNLLTHELGNGPVHDLQA